MRHMSAGTFSCPSCEGRHDRTVSSCPATGEPLTVVHKLGGTVLEGKYRIEHVIAEGGMGIVYKGLHKGIGRALAVKFLSPDACGSREMYDRFMQEARLAASVEHKGIVHVHDLGITQGGIPFIVMEHLAGRSLAARIEEVGRLSVGEACGITEQMLEVLVAVHHSGIVHRDLKPDNVFLALQSDGSVLVKILDFGIALLLEGKVPRITQPGQVYGTPHYVSPEQVRGELEIDNRTDLYSLGVIFFEMLTGEPPFDAESPVKLLAMIAEAPPPSPLDIRPDLPPAVADVVLRALAKDPAGRYEDAAGMLRAVRRSRNAREASSVSGSRDSKPSSGTYRIMAPGRDVVVSRLPAPGESERSNGRAAARREPARSRPQNRRHTPGHRVDVTPNPDLGDPED